MSETIYTDPDTGGQKGGKPQEFHCIPREAMELLAMQFWYGSGKYDDYNFRKGFPWRFHFNAIERHMSAFWRGEDFDLGTEDAPGSGLPHPIAAAWHCLALTQAMIEHPEKDDRHEPIDNEAQERFEHMKLRGEAYYDATMERMADGY